MRITEEITLMPEVTELIPHAETAHLSLKLTRVHSPQGDVHTTVNEKRSELIWKPESAAKSLDLNVLDEEQTRQRLVELLVEFIRELFGEGADHLLNAETEARLQSLARYSLEDLYSSTRLRIISARHTPFKDLPSSLEPVLDSIISGEDSGIEHLLQASIAVTATEPDGSDRTVRWVDDENGQQLTLPAALRYGLGPDRAYEGVYQHPKFSYDVIHLKQNPIHENMPQELLELHQQVQASTNVLLAYHRELIGHGGIRA